MIFCVNLIRIGNIPVAKQNLCLVTAWAISGSASVGSLASHSLMGRLLGNEKPYLKGHR